MILKGTNYFQISWFELLVPTGSFALCTSFSSYPWKLFYLKFWRTPGQIRICASFSGFRNQEEDVMWLKYCMTPVALLCESLVHAPDKVTADEIQPWVLLQIWTIKGWSCAGFQLCCSTQTSWEPDAGLLYGRAPATSRMKDPTGPFSSWNLPLLMGPDGPFTLCLPLD